MVLRCVLSGSYHRDFETLQRLYRELASNGVQILSPHRLDLIDNQTEFVRDIAEKNLSVMEIERHHLTALYQSDFMWLHCPNGYVGTSAAFEMGVAFSRRIPIYSNEKPADNVLAGFVHVVPSVFMAMENIFIIK
ncbi:hypothetical protein HY004_03250 [Candidatus Saccharibacteria bacterium]|nr:hypothetical protein [Candidatus Saccharibacteria bacterium]